MDHPIPPFDLADKSHPEAKCIFLSVRRVREQRDIAQKIRLWQACPVHSDIPTDMRTS